MTARKALWLARRGACCRDVWAAWIQHKFCASLLLDGFSVDEITRAGG